MKKNPARNVHLVKGPTNLLEKINLSIDVDSRLYKEDIEASIAHVKMLSKTKIISSSEGKIILLLCRKSSNSSKVSIFLLFELMI